MDLWTRMLGKKIREKDNRSTANIVPRVETSTEHLIHALIEKKAEKVGRGDDPISSAPSDFEARKRRME
jgi:hypothetical protein